MGQDSPPPPHDHFHCFRMLPLRKDVHELAMVNLTVVQRVFAYTLDHMKESAKPTGLTTILPAECPKRPSQQKILLPAAVLEGLKIFFTAPTLSEIRAAGKTRALKWLHAGPLNPS